MKSSDKGPNCKSVNISKKEEEGANHSTRADSRKVESGILSAGGELVVAVCLRDSVLAYFVKEGLVTDL